MEQDISNQSTKEKLDGWDHSLPDSAVKKGTFVDDSHVSTSPIGISAEYLLEIEFCWYAITNFRLLVVQLIWSEFSNNYFCVRWGRQKNLFFDSQFMEWNNTKDSYYFISQFPLIYVSSSGFFRTRLIYVKILLQCELSFSCQTSDIWFSEYFPYLCIF